MRPMISTGLSHIARTVPTPDSLLGYALGTWHSTYRDQERAILAITEAATDRTRVWEYGKSVEGRPLRLIAVSSPKNIARLEEIRMANLRLADGRGLSPTESETPYEINSGDCLDKPYDSWL